METGSDNRASLIPSAPRDGGRGATTGVSSGVADAATPMDSEGDLAGFAAGLYTGPPLAEKPTAKPKKTKERSANRKRDNSSRSSLTEKMDKASISNETPTSNASLTIQDTDDVFSPPAGPSGSSGITSGAVEGADFPADYKIIRTTKAARLALARLGGLFGLGRIETGVRLGYGEGGLACDRVPAYFPSAELSLRWDGAKHALLR